MNRELKVVIFYVLVFILQVLVEGGVFRDMAVHFCLLPLIIAALPYKWKIPALLPVAFLLGLALDMASGGVPGVNSAAATLVAALRNPVYVKLVANDNALPAQTPYSSIIGHAYYLKYIAILTAIYVAAWLLMDSFSMASPLLMLLRLIVWTAASCAVSFVFNLVIGQRH